MAVFISLECRKEHCQYFHMDNGKQCCHYLVNVFTFSGLDVDVKDNPKEVTEGFECPIGRMECFARQLSTPKHHEFTRIY